MAGPAVAGPAECPLQSTGLPGHRGDENSPSRSPGAPCLAPGTWERREQPRCHPDRAHPRPILCRCRCRCPCSALVPQLREPWHRARVSEPRRGAAPTAAEDRGSPCRSTASTGALETATRRRGTARTEVTAIGAPGWDRSPYLGPADCAGSRAGAGAAALSELRLPPPPAAASDTPPAPAERSRSAPRPARPRPPPRSGPGPARPGEQRHPRGRPDRPPLGPASTEPGRALPGLGQSRAPMARSRQDTGREGKNGQDMDREGRTQARHNQVQAKDGQTEPEHRQDASRTRPEKAGHSQIQAGHREGMAGCSKEWSDAGWAEARHSQIRQDQLCTLADLAGHSSAPALLAPEPPAHSQPSERGPSPRSGSTATNWCPRVCCPLAWPAPHSPSPWEFRQPALPHCPPTFQAAPAPRAAQALPAAQAPSWVRLWTIQKQRHR